MGTIDIFAPELAPFTIAILVMLAIGGIELAALLLGFSASGSIEAALPDAAPDTDVDTDAVEATAGAVGPLSHVLGWLSVGRMPILVLLVIFLTSFALAGYGVQLLATSILGAPIAALLAALPALVGGAYATRHLGRWLGSIFPRDQTEAASQKELIGSYATIIRGEARPGKPAEAKASDLRGRTHYLLIEPDVETEIFSAGQRVFIVGQRDNVYRAITKLKNV